ncbi:MAG: response regulator [Arcobacter sp.]|nr:response regulator [Arcobacter sp.]
MNKIDKSLFKDVTLLYVEDDLMTLEEISYVLKKYIKNLIVAKNGQEGLSLFKKHNPDMVITDINMPVMNGLEMSEKIFKINPNVPIAVTTAHSDGEYLIKAIELGIDKYILKPINLKEVLVIIQKSLNLNKINFESLEYKKYIQFILDTKPTFMFIIHSNQIEYVNSNFMDILCEEDVISIRNKTYSFKDLFEFNDIKTKKSWFQYVLESNEKKHLVYLKNINSKFYLKSKFYVSYKYFKSINRSVFVFEEIISDKLTNINKIDERLLTKNLKEKLNTI